MSSTRTVFAPVGIVHVPEAVNTCTSGTREATHAAVGARTTSQPVATVRAVVDYCARVIVNVSDVRAVTRTISATPLDDSGAVPDGIRVTLYAPAVAGSGNFAPSPVVTTNDVPDVAGDGAVAMREAAKFATGSAMSYEIVMVAVAVHV